MWRGQTAGPNNSQERTMKPSRILLPTFLLSLCGADAIAQSGFTVGGGVAVASRYSGSDERMVAPVIVLDYAFGNGFYASTMRGLGYSASLGPLQASAALGYRAARYEREKDGVGIDRGSKHLRGMGDVKGVATTNLGIGVELADGFEVHLRTEQALGKRRQGNRYSLGLSGRLLQGQRDTVVLSISANAGDRDYMQTYYGVNQAQSQASGYGMYGPGAGLYEVEAGIRWERKLDGPWSLNGTVGANRLVREARRSPLVRSATEPVAAVYATYSF